MKRMWLSSAWAGAIVASLGIGLAAEAGVPAYTLVGTFELPGPGAAFDLLPDGRALAIAGDTFYVQDSLHGSTWSAAGALPAGSVSSFGATFLRISPSGARIAVGDNRFGDAASVHFVDWSALTPGSATAPVSIASPNFEASWRDEDRLLVSGFGAEAVVNQITLGTTPETRTLIHDFAGASGGVLTDGTHLYTANGFAFGGGSLTGDIRAFALSAVDSAGSPLSFELDGQSVALALSGNALDFDGSGNLLVGGGDTMGGPGGMGFAAVIDADALAAALLGGPMATPALQLFPGDASHSYSTRYNASTGEILVSFYDNTNLIGGNTIYRYAVPAPGAAAAVGLTGLVAARRRRRG